MTFEELLNPAKTVFYKAWISEGTPEECKYYKEYFEKYPNKGSYEELYNKALKKAVYTLSTSWIYENPKRYNTPEDLARDIVINKIMLSMEYNGEDPEDIREETKKLSTEELKAYIKA